MKKEFKICTVVQGETLEGFLKNLKKAQSSATMVELRADSIKSFRVEDVAVLKKAVKVPAIFTFRHKKEEGLFTGTAIKQKEILQKAFDLGFAYVDVALGNSILKELNAKEKKQVLLSWHNTAKTPSLKELKGILNKMRAEKPSIIKMASFINDYEDVSALTFLLKERKKEEQFIIIGMGDKGKITRFMYPLMGSCIAYVSIKGEKNIAPGMVTAEDFEPILDSLKK